ncbi:MAG: hypothetical protein LAO55_06725 [Acidobacteriia bacterium]|nr:hypothetical protein [Terriglobia bacterium]
MSNSIGPVSEPMVPAQPSAESYSVQDLALFKSYSRQSYRAAFGIEAPAYDPSRLRKSWFDSTVDVSDPSNVAVYRVASQDQNGNAILRQIVIPAQEAAMVNLPGAIQYPPYIVAPTSATRDGSSINPVYLSLESDAQDLMKELGGNNLRQEELPPFTADYSSDEPRRPWEFLVRGSPVNVGALLLSRNAQGIGSPGHWDLSSPQPVWMPDPPAPTGADDTRSPREMPVRNLLPNEKLFTGLMGIQGVQRTDLQLTSDEASGKFTPDDRATLRLIYQAVSKLSS